MNYTIYPKPLSGVITAASSKSIMHRVLICASFAEDITTIINPLICDDTILTIKALEKIGVVFKHVDHNLLVYPPKSYLLNDRLIECGNSGSTIRFLMPVFSSLFESVVFHGSPRLIERLKTDDLDLLPFSYTLFNETITITRNETFSEITLEDNNTSQFISGILLTMAIRNQNSCLHIVSNSETLNPYIAMTLDVLANFGCKFNIQHQNYIFSIIINEAFQNSTFSITKRKLLSCQCAIEGDYSSAANILAMGLLGNKTIVKNLYKNSIQGDRKFLDIIKEMHGILEIGTDAVAASRSNLRATDIDLTYIPDLGPLLMALCSVSEGTSTITNYHKLELKESNRIKESIKILKKLGADINEKNNKIIIKGKEKLDGGITIDPCNDHRLIMMVVALTNRFIQRVTIMNCDCVNKSYPNFWDHYREIEGIAILEQLKEQANETND